MKVPFLSVIVPIYNVEKFLERCIDSIISQSFSNFELLLIDDGSTDSSGSICDEYAVKDDRIHVFHKANGGVSSARNLGLDNAKGEWVYFIDSDDELKENGLKIMIDCICDEVDMVLAGYEECYEDGRIVHPFSIKKVEMLSSSESVLICYEKYTRHYRYLGYLWIRLFRKQVIDDSKLRFDESIAIKEDTLFVVQYLCICSGLTCFLTTPIYKYNRHSSSVMTSLWGKWDDRYVSSFDAIRKMRYSIERAFPEDRKLILVAKEEEIDRYERIVSKQKRFRKTDRTMQRSLYDELVSDLGNFFIVKYKSRIVWGRFIRKIKRYMPC